MIPIFRVAKRITWKIRNTAGGAITRALSSRLVQMGFVLVPTRERLAEDTRMGLGTDPI